MITIALAAVICGLIAVLIAGCSQISLFRTERARRERRIRSLRPLSNGRRAR